MDNFLLTINIMLPLFVVMAAGYLARRIGWLDTHSAQVMNKLLFRLFLPILLCKNIMTATLDAGQSGGVFAFVAVSILALFLALFLIVPRLEPDASKRGVLVQGMARGNYAYFGLPLVAAMFPGRDVSLASLLVVVVVPMFNVLSVVALELYRGGKPDIKKIVLGIVCNPLILGSLAGFVLLITQARLPAVVTTSMNDLSKVASPLALFLLGASIDFKKVGGNLRQLVLSLAGKLLIHPLVFVGLAILLGFRGVELACVLIAFGAPTAVNAYTMALTMDGDAELAAEQVVFSTAFSAVTMFLFIFGLMQMGLLA